MLGDGGGGLPEKWGLSLRCDCQMGRIPASRPSGAGFLEPLFPLESFAYVDRLFDDLASCQGRAIRRILLIVVF